MKKALKIKFVNQNTEEQIVQAIAGFLAYNLAESEEKVVFNYGTSICQNSHSQEGVENDV